MPLFGWARLGASQVCRSRFDRPEPAVGAPHGMPLVFANPSRWACTLSLAADPKRGMMAARWAEGEVGTEFRPVTEFDRVVMERVAREESLDSVLELIKHEH